MTTTSKDPQPIILPKPKGTGGKPVITALKQRKTVREISDTPVSPQVLSDLLWAACGVNRTEGPFGIPGRTAATASNSQEIDVYVVLPEGTYLYDPFRHRLEPVAPGDLRALCINPGQADLVAHAPVNLIFVADVERLIHTQGYQEPGLKDPEVQKSYYFADTGLMAGNVYLYSASAGLAAWFHNCNKPGLMTKLRLRTSQRVLFGQTVGFPVSSER
jgi:hypothetical protein